LYLPFNSDGCLMDATLHRDKENLHRNSEHNYTFYFFELSRFGDHITRIEAHFSDENGQKEGQNDKL
jgi:hypothetical protein